MSDLYPSAIFAKTPASAMSIIQTAPYYAAVVDASIKNVPETMYHMCLCAAAEIYKTGMLASSFEAVVDLGEEYGRNSGVRRKIQLKELKNQRTKIVGNLQASGILPTGLGWFLVRWIVLPFVLELLKRWAIGPDDES